MGVLHLNDETFEEEVIKFSIPVLVDFYAGLVLHSAQQLKSLRQDR